MNRIDTLFSRLRSENRRALMPFVTAGDPDLATTALLITELVNQGAHLVEVGIPYSDPIADGPVIAASYHRALERGVKVAHIFQTLRTLRAEGSARFNETPMVSMVSYAIIHRLGADRYLNDAATAGLDGLIVPDLPVEESADLLDKATAARTQADPAHHAHDASRARDPDRPVDHGVYLLRVGRGDHGRAEEPSAPIWSKPSPGCGPRPNCRSASASGSAVPTRCASLLRWPTA